MPEYLAPGVYVEEVSFRAKSIEGVSTTTTGFIGPTRYGPTDLPPDVLTSLGDFENVYGGRQQLVFKSADGRMTLPPTHNYMWHAARAFFEEGGKRLYVVRVYRPAPGGDGRADAWLPSSSPAQSAGEIRIAARFPGGMGAMQVTLTLRPGQNILVSDQNQTAVRGLNDNDLVWISQLGLHSPLPSPLPGDVGRYYVAQSYFDAVAGRWTWRFVADPTSPFTSPLASPLSGPATLSLGDLAPSANPSLSDKVRVVTLTVTATPLDGSRPSQVWSDIPLDPRHTQANTPDDLFDQFAETFTSPDRARSVPLIITRPAGTLIQSGVDVLEVLFRAAQARGQDLRAALNDPGSTDDQRSLTVLLTGGDDGVRPTADRYEGTADPESTVKTGLKAFEDIDDISIVAAPGSTYGLERDYTDDAHTIMSLLILHATNMKYRIAVLDSGDGESVGAVRRLRARFDSTHAALYYPWVRILDPLTDTEINVPPSGFVCAIYARNDINRGVYKAPANEVVNLALGFELLLNKGQQEVLNPEAINCFRFFEGRGFRLWGARLISSDPEWKYVNLRRYFAYLEHSIDKGTQFAVFEPNGPLLWGNIRRTIENFLLNEWQSGALLGTTPDSAFFVRCDRSTMTQNDLDNGRLVCLIGVAPLYPAEFVIFRIGQFTASSPA